MSINPQNQARNQRAEQRALRALDEELKARLLKHRILPRRNANVSCDDKIISDEIYEFDDGVIFTISNVYNETNGASYTVLFKQENKYGLIQGDP